MCPSTSVRLLTDAQVDDIITDWLTKNTFPILEQNTPLECGAGSPVATGLAQFMYMLHRAQFQLQVHNWQGPKFFQL